MLLFNYYIRTLLQLFACLSVVAAKLLLLWMSYLFGFFPSVTKPSDDKPTARKKKTIFRCFTVFFFNETVKLSFLFYLYKRKQKERMFECFGERVRSK